MSTYLFTTISRYGRRVTKKRAHEKNLGLAAREAVRHERPGVVLGSEGPGGLDGFFEDIRIEQSYRPLWFRGVMRMHWWAERHGIRPTCRNIKYFWQRGKRGYSDRDLWGFDHFLATVIRDGVRDINKIKHGWPGEPMTYEEWGTILTEISDGMQAYLDLCSSGYDWSTEVAMTARKDLGFAHFVKYFQNLWD